MKVRTAFTIPLSVRAIIASLCTLGLIDIKSSFGDLNLIFHDYELCYDNGSIQALDETYSIRIPAKDVTAGHLQRIANGPVPDKEFFNTKMLFSEVFDMTVSMVSIEKGKDSIGVFMSIPKFAQTINARNQDPKTGGCAHDN